MNRTRQLDVGSTRVTYDVRTSRRARYMRLTVSHGGAVTVTLPFGQPLVRAERFVADHVHWLVRKIAQMRSPGSAPYLRRTRADYLRYKEQARETAVAIANRLRMTFGLQYRSISIRDQKTRWGSCSRRGDVSLNYRLVFLPLATQEYLIAHELCHVREFNHSRAFWRLVAGVIPDYRECRKALRAYRLR